jgi:hypothetical protein
MRQISALKTSGSASHGLCARRGPAEQTPVRRLLAAVVKGRNREGLRFREVGGQMKVVEDILGGFLTERVADHHQVRDSLIDHDHGRVRRRHEYKLHIGELIDDAAKSFGLRSVGSTASTSCITDVQRSCGQPTCRSLLCPSIGCNRRKYNEIEREHQRRAGGLAPARGNED